MPVFGAEFEPGTHIIVEPKTASSGHTYEFVKREDGSWRGTMHHVKSDKELAQGYQIKEVLGLNGVFHSLKASIAELSDTARKRFDDAIYRRKHNDPRTAEDVWDDLLKAQESTDAMAAYRCAGYLNELVRRGQIEDWR